MAARLSCPFQGPGGTLSQFTASALDGRGLDAYGKDGGREERLHVGFQ